MDLPFVLAALFALLVVLQVGEWLRARGERLVARRRRMSPMDEEE